MHDKYNGYKLLAHPNLQKIIKKNLPEEYREILNEKLSYLSKNYNHPSLNNKKISVSNQFLKRNGIDEVWEFYINDKKYRCIYYISHNDQIIIIAFVGNHTQIQNKIK